MSNEQRDELAEAIAGYQIGTGYYSVDVGYSDAQAIADDILAAGYRRPRTITTVEELDALPGWSIIETWGICLVRSTTDEACWVSTTGHWAYSSAALIKNYNSATVLHEAVAP